MATAFVHEPYYKNNVLHWYGYDITLFDKLNAMFYFKFEDQKFYAAFVNKDDTSKKEYSARTLPELIRLVEKGHKDNENQPTDEKIRRKRKS